MHTIVLALLCVIVIAQVLAQGV